MDTISLITIAGLVLANIGTTLGLFMWATNQSIQASQSIREENQHFSKETRELIKAISDEMKDFHGRLCAIEERNLNRNIKG